MLAGTGTEIGVTYAGDPSITPDGKHIVFNKFVEATEDQGIWIMNLDGSGQHEIGDLPYGDPNVSPDGDTLLMLGSKGDDGRQQALFTANMSGGDVKQITSYALDAAGKSDWAPNGRRVITSDNANIPEQSANVVTVPADGGEPFHVTHYTDPDVRAYVGGYSPNGKWIVFRLEDHGQFALCLIRPNGKGLRRSCRSPISGHAASTGVRPRRGPTSRRSPVNHAGHQRRTLERGSRGCATVSTWHQRAFGNCVSAPASCCDGWRLGRRSRSLTGGGRLRCSRHCRISVRSTACGRPATSWPPAPI